MLSATPILVIHHSAVARLYLHIYSVPCLPVSSGLAAHMFAEVIYLTHWQQEHWYREKF
jgi:hypothetical protein